MAWHAEPLGRPWVLQQLPEHRNQFDFDVAHQEWLVAAGAISRLQLPSWHPSWHPPSGTLGWKGCDRLSFLGPWPLNGRFNTGGTVFDQLVDDNIYLVIEYLGYRCQNCRKHLCWQPRLLECPRCRTDMPSARYIIWDSVSDSFVLGHISYSTVRLDDAEGEEDTPFAIDLTVDEGTSVWTAVEVD